MDRRERAPNPEETLRMAMEANQANIWTSLPGIIDSFDPVAMTCKVKPAVRVVQRLIDGSLQWIKLPLLLDCPVVFPSGGGFTLTFPLESGDECLINFSSRCIDGWWQLGDVQNQPELRMHDLSDGFVIPGPKSQKKRFTVNTNATQLRSNDGQFYLEITKDGKIRIQAEDVEVHATRSYKWDVGGLGESWTYTGGVNWTHTTWQTGATITNVSLPINPPEGP